MPQNIPCIWYYLMGKPLSIIVCFLKQRIPDITVHLDVKDIEKKIYCYKKLQQMPRDSSSEFCVRFAGGTMLQMVLKLGTGPTKVYIEKIS